MTSSKLLYAQTEPVDQKTTDQGWADIKGLGIRLPATSAGHDRALITLNVPNPYATGTDAPAGDFGLMVNGSVEASMPTACFSYSTNGSARVPTTLVAEVMLGDDSTHVQAVWKSIRNSTVIVDTPCSLSAVIGN
jgi:hypothetical protein